MCVCVYIFKSLVYIMAFLNKIRNLDAEQLLKAIKESGYEDIADILKQRDISGQTFLELKELDTVTWKLTRTQVRKLIDFIGQVKTNPFIIKENRQIPKIDTNLHLKGKLNVSMAPAPRKLINTDFRSKLESVINSPELQLQTPYSIDIKVKGTDTSHSDTNTLDASMKSRRLKSAELVTEGTYPRKISTSTSPQNDATKIKDRPAIPLPKADDGYLTPIELNLNIHYPISYTEYKQSGVRKTSVIKNTNFSENPTVSNSSQFVELENDYQNNEDTKMNIHSDQRNNANRAGGYVNLDSTVKQETLFSTQQRKISQENVTSVGKSSKSTFLENVGKLLTGKSTKQANASFNYENHEISGGVTTNVRSSSSFRDRPLPEIPKTDETKKSMNPFEIKLESTSKTNTLSRTSSRAYAMSQFNMQNEHIKNTNTQENIDEWSLDYEHISDTNTDEAEYVNYQASDIAHAKVPSVTTLSDSLALKLAQALQERNEKLNYKKNDKISTPFESDMDNNYEPDDGIDQLYGNISEIHKIEIKDNFNERTDDAARPPCEYSPENDPEYKNKEIITSLEKLYNKNEHMNQLLEQLNTSIFNKNKIKEEDRADCDNDQLYGNIGHTNAIEIQQTVTECKDDGVGPPGDNYMPDDAFSNKMYDESIYENLRPQCVIEKKESATKHIMSEEDEYYIETLCDVTHYRFFRNTDRKGARQLLKDLSDGAFLFRKSAKYFLVLTAKCNGTVYNLGIEKTSKDKIRLSADFSKLYPEFESLKLFVEYYSKESITFLDHDNFVEILLKPILP